MIINKNNINILQNFKQVDLHPWPHIIIKNALPKNIHDELLSTLPDKRLNQQPPRDKHGKLTWLIYEIVPEQYPVSNIWKEFIDFHTSREFFDQVLDIFSPWTNKLPVPKEDIILTDRAVGGTPKDNCYTEFGFVKHPPVNNISSRTPHTDNEKEIYAGLLYLKYPEDKSTGGGFALHEPNKLRMNIKREYVSPGPIVKVCPYKSNNFVLFMNKKNTQHSVEPRQGAVHPRWSINMFGQYAGNRVWKHIPVEWL